MARQASPQALPAPKLGGHRYARELRALQIELVKLHRNVIARGRKVLVILEGRDAAGKDGTIKRIVEHLSPREVRVVAPGKPSDREESEWYFQRFTGHLPAAQEIVLFNRSWYNRAGVEHVMKFCTRAQYEAFLESAPEFERMLVRSGIHLLKYYLDISRAEQRRRLRQRRRDPLKQWKLSPVDEAAQRHWKDYSRARDRMLERTHTPHAPWIVVRADDKHQARLNVIRDMLARVPAPDVKPRLARPDPRVLREFSAQLLASGWVAR
ncbi:MAG TPA: polyphosphate kinase 2 [Steroidobacteraceae bacterium]|nr:polyphosphate kinase 2 [Steroidobacteraceae bacterium]